MPVDVDVDGVKSLLTKFPVIVEAITLADNTMLSALMLVAVVVPLIVNDCRVVALLTDNVPLVTMESDWILPQSKFPPRLVTPETVRDVSEPSEVMLG